MGLLNHQLASTFNRFLLEDNVNLQYYIRHPEKLDDFRKSSGKAEQEFADFVEEKRKIRAEQNIKWTETELQWEEGLLDSAIRGLFVAGLGRSDKVPRTPTMKDKAKEVGLEGFYTSYRLESHAVHGDWFDIARYNLEEKNSKYYPVFQIKGTDVRQLNAILHIVYKSLVEFVTIYSGHGINVNIVEEMTHDEQIIQNFDDMFFKFRHKQPVITGLED